jgi:hypothetical protein
MSVDFWPMQRLSTRRRAAVFTAAMLLVLLVLWVAIGAVFTSIVEVWL